MTALIASAIIKSRGVQRSSNQCAADNIHHLLHAQEGTCPLVLDSTDQDTGPDCLGARGLSWSQSSGKK